MKKDKIQYWLYAILNSKFGSEVTFTRDPLHSQYEVNKHGFEISTNTLDIEVVENWLIDKLIQSGFSHEKWFGVMHSFLKENEAYVSIRSKEKGFDNPNPVIYCFIG